MSAIDVSRQVLWHRFSRCADEMDTANHINRLVEVAKQHGHEYHVMRSMFDAADEVELAQRRARKVQEEGASSFVAAGFRERHLYMPIISFGMFEGEVFSIYQEGAAAGVRVIFVGPQERFETLPYKMREGTDESGVLCGCESGF